MPKLSRNIVPNISIVVVNHNGRHLLEKCFASLMKTTYPNIEIIMVDNASKDDSVNFVSNTFPSVKIQRCVTNLGYAGGCNKGASIAKGDYIVFMNNDIEVSKGWIKSLIKTCLRPDVAICGGKLLFSEKKDHLYSAGGMLNPFSMPIDRGFSEAYLILIRANSIEKKMLHMFLERL
jgi:GT2 family glycosyltransferase